jgi:hypothetical protein
MSQKTETGDSTAFYISKLNWHSYGLTGTYFQKIYLLDDANILLSARDTSKIRKLINNIGDSTKTVAIHILLTQLLEPEKQIFQERYHYADDKSMEKVDFIYNSLIWTTSDGINFQIDQSEIRRIKGYWISKTSETKFIP